MDTVIWKERKRTLFGLPLSFTVYSLTEKCLFIKTGFLKIQEEEIRLYRILDISLSRTLEERLFRLGTIHCCTADKTAPEMDIKRIPHSREIRTLLSDRVEEARSERYVGVREFMGDEDDSSHAE